MLIFYPPLLLDYLLARLRLDPRDERGVVSTEVAIVTVLAVGIGVAVLAVFWDRAVDNANNIPVVDSPEGG